MELVFILFLTVFFYKAINRVPLIKGKLGEVRIERKLRHYNKKKLDGLILKNLYLPLKNGETTEIDILYITKKGLVVIESINQNWSFSGKDTNKYWQVRHRKGKDIFGRMQYTSRNVYNPTWQNKTHINALKDILSNNLTYHSVIVFSNEATIKDVQITKHNSWICNLSKFRKVLKSISSEPDKLSLSEVNLIYNQLKPFTNVDQDTKKSHIQYARRQARYV